MPHRRTSKAGSFGGHFDDLVKQFPDNSGPIGAPLSEQQRRVLKEKRDIHALLFERAWQLDPEDGSGNAA